MPDGRAWAVVYVVSQRVTTMDTMRETVDEHQMSFMAAKVLMTEFKAANVIPYAFALHHSAPGGVPTGHFTALRVDPARYVASTTTAARRQRMLESLDEILQAHGWYPTGTSPSAYDEGTRTTRPQLLPPADGPASGSVYDPSTGGSDSSTQISPSADASSHGASPPTPPSSDATPLFEASLVTPTSPLETDDYLLLLRHVSRGGPVRVDEEPSLAKATRDNTAALKRWKLSIRKSRPEVAAVIDKATSVDDACAFLLGDPELLLNLLQHIPFIPVLSARTCKDLFTKLGKMLVALGRMHMLSRLAVDATIPEPARDFCAQWAMTFAGLPDTESRWVMAQTADRWDRLRSMMPSRNLPQRVVDGLEDERWGALIVHLLVSPSPLRTRMMALTLPTACDTLLTWTSHSERVVASAAAANALHAGLWMAPTEFLTELDRLSQTNMLATATQVVVCWPRHY